jgi:hypothetical protein
MKPISVHVADQDYQSFKLLADRMGKPVAELIREAMSEYLKRRGQPKGSLFDISPFPSGRQLSSWTREELLDEMLDP